MFQPGNKTRAGFVSQVGTLFLPLEGQGALTETAGQPSLAFGPRQPTGIGLGGPVLFLDQGHMKRKVRFKSGLLLFVHFFKGHFLLHGETGNVIATSLFNNEQACCQAIFRVIGRGLAGI